MDHMIDDSERLKPCPFCGGAATFDHDDDGWNWIECTACGASTNARVSAMDDCKPLLLEQWNKRLPQTQQAGPVRLTEADLQECKRLADAGSPVPRMSWSQRLAFAIETAVFERNGLKPQAKPNGNSNWRPIGHNQ
jgi:Lar family restriction alleviation protein